MTTFILMLSAICFVLGPSISQYDKEINYGFCAVYDTKMFKIIMEIAKCISLVPFMMVFRSYFSLFITLVLWVVFYFVVKVFITWLFCTIFGVGKGGAFTTFIILIIATISLIIGFAIF